MCKHKDVTITNFTSNSYATKSDRIVVLDIGILTSKCKKCGEEIEEITTFAVLDKDLI